jgi:hypothetical protein
MIGILAGDTVHLSAAMSDAEVRKSRFAGLSPANLIFKEEKN